MGGWRCTYRNCSAAPDGKTHVFHYPVFDKVRCLKWLTNAGRLEFLNLKLSQLKNRVVCQNHFKDECFMNYKKDKLTFEAVPTEHGHFNKSVANIDENITLPFTFEDIENSETRTLTAREKKANFSTIYAEFLTDPIIHSADNIPETDCDKKPHKTEKDNDFINFSIWSHKTPQESSAITTSHSVSQPLYISENIENGISFQIEISPTQDVMNIPEPTPNSIDNFNSTKQHSENIILSSQINLNDNTDALLHNLNITEGLEKKSVVKSNKIKIISEKKLTMPLPLVGTFKPVCPTGILNPRKRKVETEPTNKENRFSSLVNEEPLLLELKASADPMEHKSPNKPNLLEPKNDSKTTSPSNKIQNGNMVSFSKSLSSRNKVPPERIAAIEEKRSFNKKLRDMIEFCLDDKEENTKTLVNTKPTKISQSEMGNKKSPQAKDKVHQQSEKCTTRSMSKNVKKGVEDKREIESKVNEKEVHNSSKTNSVLPDYKLTVLEARLSRMENLLLKKVGENRERIDNLKQILSKSNDVKKRSTHTETIQNTEMHKKQLFNEISKYLSPDLNSLIYEELFMKGFKPTMPYSNVCKKKVGLSPIKRQRR